MAVKPKKKKAVTELLEPHPGAARYVRRDRSGRFKEIVQIERRNAPKIARAVGRTVICVIGDIIESRQIPDRGKVQRQLSDVLKAINSRPYKKTLSPYTLTLGDEFQSVYRQGDGIFHDLFSIAYGVHPIRLRFSIAIGSLFTPVNQASALGMDGPGFYLARAGIDQLRRNGGTFNVSWEGGPVPRWIQPFLDILSDQSQGWNKNRFRILEQMLIDEKESRIARETGLSMRAIYKNIRAASLRSIMVMLALIEEEIRHRVQE